MGSLSSVCLLGGARNEGSKFRERGGGGRLGLRWRTIDGGIQQPAKSRLNAGRGERCAEREDHRTREGAREEVREEDHQAREGAKEDARDNHCARVCAKEDVREGDHSTRDFAREGARVDHLVRACAKEDAREGKIIAGGRTQGRGIIVQG